VWYLNHGAAAGARSEPGGQWNGQVEVPESCEPTFRLAGREAPELRGFAAVWQRFVAAGQESEVASCNNSVFATLRTVSKSLIPLK